jgi:hypothetical protein
VSLKRELKHAILELESATEIIRIIRKEKFSDVLEVMNSLNGGLSKRSKTKSDFYQDDGKNQTQRLGSRQNVTTEELKVTFKNNSGLYSRAKKRKRTTE